MTRFSDELRIIPRTAWAIAVLAYAGLTTLLLQVAIPSDAKLSHWPFWCQLLFGAGIPLILFAHVVLIGYVNGDARRRGMRYVLWTFLTALIPNGIGIILYFVLREPLLVSCGQCGAPGRANFTFCPKCGAELSPACPQCRRPVERGWANCAHCGAKTSAAAKSV
jgi:double zinc ribbon protein